MEIKIGDIIETEYFVNEILDTKKNQYGDVVAFQVKKYSKKRESTAKVWRSKHIVYSWRSI